MMQTACLPPKFAVKSCARLEVLNKFPDAPLVNKKRPLVPSIARAEFITAYWKAQWALSGALGPDQKLLVLGAHFFVFFATMRISSPQAKRLSLICRRLQERVKKHKPWSKYDQQDHESFVLHAFLYGSAHGRR
jgi:hypothetical protein